MKFKVTGSNRDTGARMILEFEADSKAAAERKATQTGMSVNRVENISDGHVAHAGPTSSGRGRGSGGGKLRLLVVVVILAAVAYWWFVMKN